MTFMEWRKFKFFDLKKGVDEGHLLDILAESELTATTSGNNQLVFGNSLGQIHLISRAWRVTTFRSYEIAVSLAYQLKNSPLLVTIGIDEPGINPLIKVWDTNRFDKSGLPHCYRISRAIPGNRAVEASTLCVHDGLQLMAVGFVDGSLILYRGDITRGRNSKQKVFKDTNSAITGLAFKTSSNVIYLFVATNISVFVYNVTQRDKEQKFTLDSIGCPPKCSILAESMQESPFMIGKNNVVICYTPDGKGACYPVEGDILMLEWFRTYLIIISKTNRTTSNIFISNDSTAESNPESHLITVLDIHNKFIVFSSTLDNVKAVLSEWRAFYILDSNNNMYLLDEKDLQSKLSLLFKKNFYDVAISTAKSQQYDSDGLVDIFKQYGDHLYAKGDHSGAIEQYIKTIGKLEPSYVIRKFLDSQHIELLTMYLQALHKRKQASEDHTTLLLNCYTKLNNTVGQSDLKEFILMKDPDLDFDVDVAIKVCRQGSAAEALMLAKKHKKHDWYIKLQIEDHQKYSDVIDYISNLEFEEAETYMKKYGHILVKHAPFESTEFLKRLCTNYKPLNKPLVSENALSGNIEETHRADPEDYIHLFLSNSERLVEFLEHLINEGIILSVPVNDTLLEHYLHVWANQENVSEKNKFAQKALKLMQNPDIKYDKPQALVVCHMHSFSEGILYLYEEEKLYQQILRYHMTRQDTSAVLACCRRFGHQEPTLWIQTLWSCVRDFDNPPKELLSETLSVIAKERLLSPQLIVDAIGTGKAAVTLEHIRSYINSEFQQECKITDDLKELTTKYTKDIEKLKQQLEVLKNGPIVIQGSLCAACRRPLELPSLYFLCQHNYHQYCFQSFADNDNECPACSPENKNLAELLKAREHNKDLHESFHSQLEKANDGFSVAAEYFGRSVFNKYTVITDDTIDKNLQKLKAFEQKDTSKKTSSVKVAKIEEPKVNYGLGAEARLRQLENARSESKNIPIVPTPEGRLRVQEHRYSSSLDANAMRSLSGNLEPFRKTTTTKVEPPKNPFEDDDYDESKNPFADDDFDDSNPFKEDIDCDKNLNHLEM